MPPWPSPPQSLSKGLTAVPSSPGSHRPPIRHRTSYPIPMLPWEITEPQEGSMGGCPCGPPLDGVLTPTAPSTPSPRSPESGHDSLHPAHPSSPSRHFHRRVPDSSHQGTKLSLRRLSASSSVSPTRPLSVLLLEGSQHRNGAHRKGVLDKEHTPQTPWREGH